MGQEQLEPAARASGGHIPNACSFGTTSGLSTRRHSFAVYHSELVLTVCYSNNTIKWQPKRRKGATVKKKRV